MSRNGRRDSGRRHEVMGNVEPDSGRGETRTSAAGEKQIERPVEHQDRGERRSSERGSSREETPAEVERRGSGRSFEQKSHPWDASPRQIGVHHAPHCPTLEMPPTDCRVELDPLAHGNKPHAQLDVFDARMGESPFVEASSLDERVAPDGS
jgi:hypothetical protein